MIFMFRDHRSLIRVRIASIMTALALAVVALAPGGVRAEGLSDQAHSLAITPADAAFYSASLRQQEQLDTFLASKAYARLLEVPVVQLAKMQIGFQWQQSPEPTVTKIREYVESEEGQRVVALAKQLFAEETFVFASSELVPLLQLFIDINAVSRQAQLEALAKKETDEHVVAERIAEMLRERVADLNVPEVVFGFRIHDPEQAAAVLDHLHSVAVELLEEHQPELAQQVEREQIDGHEFLTLKLDGSMIPWDKIQSQTDEETVDDEKFAEWKELLSDKTITVALGVVDEFVILTFGDSTDHLKDFGKGPSLADHPPLKRLEKHAGERIASIAYVDEALMKAANSPQRSINDVTGLAEIGIHAAEVEDDQRKALVADLQSLGKEVLKYIPEPGTLLAINYLTPRGYEGYQYNLGTQPMLVSTEPLTILGHVGGSPLFFAASHSEQSVENYDQTIALVSKVASQVEKIVEKKASPDDWAKYLKYRDDALDLLGRLNRTVREHLFPALADGQQALVVDAAASSTQWFQQMPAALKPLPMLELGLSFSVSDEEKLRQGVAELFAIADDTAALLHEASPDEVPAIDLPQPKVDTVDDATLYSFMFPDQWGVSSQIAANGGLTDSAAAISLMPDFTERLLKSAPLKIDTSIDLDRPAAKATHLQVAKIVDAIRPWIDYGFDIAMGNIKVDEEEESGDDAEAEPVDPDEHARVMQMGFVLPQVHQLLNVLTAVQNHTSITYQEDDAWVTHSETYLKDLE